MDENADFIAQLEEMHLKGILTQTELAEKLAAIKGGTIGKTEGNPKSRSIQDRINAFFEGRKWAAYAALTAVILVAMPLMDYGKSAIEGLLGFGSSNDYGYSDLCLLAGDPKGKVSMDHHVSYFTNALKAGGSTIMWEKTDDGVILRVHASDKLTGEDHNMGLELTRTANATPMNDCKNAKEGAFASRMTFDGETISGFPLALNLRLTMAALAENDADHDTSGEKTSEAARQNDPTQQADASVTKASDQKPFDLCYHLDSCSLAKVLSEQTELSFQDERLVKASMQFTDPVQVQSADETIKNPHWESPKPMYVICSSKRPTLLSQTDNNQWSAEVLDVASFLGVQADNITIYLNLCHPGKANEVISNPAAYGYKSLPDGGGENMTVSSPQTLFSSN